MRQETGSNQPDNVITISVRLMSNGDPFLISNYIHSSGSVEDAFLRVELLSKRALLVPTELLEKSSKEQELKVVGIAVAADEDIVTIVDRDLTVLVVAPRELTSSLETEFAGRYEFTTPLLRRPVSDKAHMILDVCDELATVKIYDKDRKLRFVDVYDAQSTASIIFWVQRLSSVMKLSGYTLYIYRGDATLSRLLNKNFKNTLYANNKRSI